MADLFVVMWTDDRGVDGYTAWIADNTMHASRPLADRHLAVLNRDYPNTIRERYVAEIRRATK